LTYKGEGVYEWTHFLKSYNSYGWYDGCKYYFVKVQEKVESGDPFITTEKSQSIWDSMSLELQKKCIKEDLNNIKVTKVSNNNFYKILFSWVDWLDKFIILDIGTYKTYDLTLYLGDALNIKKILIWKSWIYILFWFDEMWFQWGLVLANLSISKTIFENYYINEWKDIVKATNFQLLPNKKVKIFYTKWDSKKVYTKIISVK
jgi:hypothetical protein